LPNVGWQRAGLAAIEAKLDGSGNFVNVLAARAGSPNKVHCEFGIWNEYGQMIISRIACAAAQTSLLPLTKKGSISL
jgi:hypothetical protein